MIMNVFYFLSCVRLATSAGVAALASSYCITYLAYIDRFNLKLKYYGLRPYVLSHVITVEVA